jgi:hypothetical protein
MCSSTNGWCRGRWRWYYVALPIQKPRQVGRIVQ